MYINKNVVHQVGDQTRLYYDARSTNHQDLQSTRSFHETHSPLSKKWGGGGWTTASLAAITSPPRIWPIRQTLSASASYCNVAFLRHFKLQHSLLPQISVTVQSTTYAMPGSQSTICRVYTDTCTARNWLSLFTNKGFTANV